MDVHSEAATIREDLTFSSFLRQDASISDAKKYDSVSECIELLGLEDIADQIIRGSSMEQMKRLTIGVELAAQPSVIFLDEPTSGLDALVRPRSLWMVCNIPGVASLPKGYNPATWMLECIGAGVSNTAANGMDFVQIFNNSSYKLQLARTWQRKALLPLHLSTPRWSSRRSVQRPR
ncbi:unnamed protein product [Phytophthora lilii]|uniref:Unnamed protein product n=1 Tax=Phytophthora lilii TaxID=2077276 RepID=A0A9W6WVL4_9STRA|nr:unnamed protein product [Phytophthora lilii]